MNENEIINEIRKNPDNSAPYINLCKLYISTANTDRLKQLLQAACSRFPFDAAFFKFKALCAISEKDFNPALTDYKYCFSLNPADSDSADAVGVIYQIKGMYEDAAVWHKKALALKPEHEGYLFNCAVAYDKAGKANIAEHKYKEILQGNPTNHKAALNLAVLYKKRNDFVAARELLENIILKSPANFSALMELAGLYKAQENNKAALEIYRKASEINPSDETALFMVKMLGGEDTAKPPEKYVESLFDMFSDDFDDKLVNVLEYKVPKLIFDVAVKFFNGRKNLRLLDLGAGTGLFAEVFEPYVSYATAIDLSSRMLEKAEKKKLYDRIICGDIEKETGKMAGETFDVIAAADVFVYLGNLEPIFANITHLLQKGGLLIFSVETNDMNDNDYCLKDTARYGHSKEYISKLAEKYGFKEACLFQTELRKNKNKPINGFIAAYTVPE